MTTTARRSTRRIASVRPVRALRTRVGHHTSPARRRAVLDAYTRRVNRAAGYVTAAEYLADVVGADAAFVASYGSWYGKAVAKAWREATGTEPAKYGLARRGTLLLAVFAYGTDERSTAVLDAGARSYKRTALLLAA